MKKILTLILAAALALSLVVCGGGKKDLSEIFLGDWTEDYDSPASGDSFFDLNGMEFQFPSGDLLTATYSVFKGGALEIKIYDNDTGFEIKYTGTWEISDDILVCTYDNDVVRSYEIHTDTEPYTLSVQGSGFPTTLTKS